MEADCCGIRIAVKHVIHIGANKTASTLLQRRLFACHPTLAYLGEDCRDYGLMKPILETLVQKDASYYDESRTRDLLQKTAAEEGKGAMVFSSEDILTSRHPSVCATRLGRLMPTATVVLVLRNQLTVWPSWYINHGAYLKGVPRRYWRRPVTFDDWLEYCFAFPDQTPVEAMNYWRHWQIFSKVFGAENMKVLLYEDLIRSPDAYYAGWAEILGIPPEEIAALIGGQRERTRYTQRRFVFDQCKATVPMACRLVEPFLGSWLESGRTAQVSLPPGRELQIKEYYAPGNRAIAEATGLCLSLYGYPV